MNLFHLNLAAHPFSCCIAAAVSQTPFLSCSNLATYQKNHRKKALNYNFITRFIIYCINNSDFIGLFVYLLLEGILTHRLRGTTQSLTFQPLQGSGCAPKPRHSFFPQTLLNPFLSFPLTALLPISVLWVTGGITVLFLGYFWSSGVMLLSFYIPTAAFNKKHALFEAHCVFNRTPGTASW